MTERAIKIMMRPPIAATVAAAVVVPPTEILIELTKLTIFATRI